MVVRENGHHIGLKTSDARQGLADPVLLPMGLGRGRQMLNAAAATTFGQDAGRAAPVGRRLQHAQQLRHEVAFRPVDKPNPHLFPRQGAGHEHHLLLDPTDPLAVMGQPMDRQVQLGAHQQTGAGGWRWHQKVFAQP